MVEQHVFECIVAVDSLAGTDFAPTLVHVPFLAPLDVPAIEELAREYQVLLVVEEHLPTGGLTTAVSEIVATGVGQARVIRLGLPPRYASAYGSQREHWENHGLTSDGIASSITRIQL